MLKGRTVVSVLGVLAMVMLMCGSAMGAYGDFVLEDFESPDVVGNPPLPTSGSTPYWIHDSSSGSGFTTIEIAENASGNTTQFYKDPGYEGSTVMGAREDWQIFDTPEDMPDEFTFAFDVLVRNANSNNPLQLFFRNSPSGFYAIVGVTINMNEVWINTISGTDVLVGAGKDEEWQHIDTHINTTTNYISVALDGGTPVSMTYTPEGGPTKGDRLYINRQLGNPAFYYLDNLLITEVPEPVTLSLLAIGGLLGLLKRKSR